ncbi:Helix-turn-helix domain-containing protein [Actinopolymorpha cephalotaxi]|uniref:Helix-turn-helix domain-containing protein n=1 Tax=Actinopolymorpha cephalotaxi TaxID=504797 RepID=A0A1I2PCF3_9ACTN|nr:Helix-turn-helix domain-containing protein [Actinopolymorpha cephalotaxi]
MGPAVLPPRLAWSGGRGHAGGVKANREELARVIRRARERVGPGEVGLPVGRHRRVPGLRREELAQLAGISVDYVVRLEQGRGPQPSEQVLTALARALRLDTDERDHLFHVAGGTPPRQGQIDLHVRPGVLRLIDRFTDLPAMVLSAKSDILAWNAMSSALLGDWSALSPERRNQSRLRFLPDPNEPPHSPIGGSPEERARTSAQAVANLRAAAGRYPDDPGLRRLLADLRRGSAEFRELWDDVDASVWRSHTKTVIHPSLGELTLECDTLHIPESDQLLVVYSAAPGTSEADALALLRVVGTQDLTPAADLPARDR